MSTPPTSSFTRWDAHEAIGTAPLSEDVVILVARCRLRDHWFVALQTLRRAQPPAQGWEPRSQIVLPRESVATVCALLQRALEQAQRSP